MFAIRYILLQKIKVTDGTEVCTHQSFATLILNCFNIRSDILHIFIRKYLKYVHSHNFSPLSINLRYLPQGLCVHSIYASLSTLSVYKLGINKLQLPCISSSHLFVMLQRSDLHVSYPFWNHTVPDLRQFQWIPLSSYHYSSNIPTSQLFLYVKVLCMKPSSPVDLVYHSTKYYIFWPATDQTCFLPTSDTPSQLFISQFLSCIELLHNFST